jgi:PAS domain S-box-containing protein
MSSRDGLVAAAAGPIGGSLLLVLLSGVLLWLALRPVTTLARAANRLAGGLEVDVPYLGRRDEVGVIARALEGWRTTAASQRLIWQHSPIAMLIFGADFAIQGVSPGQLAMFRSDPRRLTDREFMATAVANATHPDYRQATTRMYARLLSGKSDTETMEKRYLRNDGTGFWGRCVVSLIRSADGAPDHFVSMVEDVSERRDKVEQAARVQRDLLPEGAPEVEGYELAGMCLPSREMGGDFYDWQRRGPATLTLTLGDVMGKDMPAALLMATVAAALRASVAQGSAAGAVRLAAESVQRDLERSGAFVTLFHGWLEALTGRLRYVDAGHGLLAVVGRGGVRLPARSRSLPLGVMAGERYGESELTLERGETLVVYSDGVLDVHPELEGRPEAVGELLRGAESAGEMAERLVTGPGTAADDVTVLVVSRSTGHHGRP